MAGPVCRGCGQPIAGRYVSALGADWHPGHFRCAGCGRPIGEEPLYERDGRPYDERCYAERCLPRCAVGGEPLRAGWLENAWGERFCAAHGAGCPRCRFCGRLAPGDEADEARCPACRAAAVWREGDARARFARLITWGIRHGMTVPAGTTIRVELVEAARLGRDGGEEAGARVLGRAEKTATTRDGRVVEVRADRVLVERGLPAPLFEGVASHELGHAWLAVQQVSGLPTWAEEGFCELLAHRWYGEQGTVSLIL